MWYALEVRGYIKTLSIQFVCAGLATSFYDATRDDNLTRGLVRLLSEAEQEVPDWLEEGALKAVGTGYGTDNTHSRDSRNKFAAG